MHDEDPDQDVDGPPIDQDGADPALVSVRVIVHGRVQGVFFRATTAEQAAIHRVSGWVRNRADGAVEAHFEGARAAVDAMVAWCGIGSPHARVARVEVESARLRGVSTFEIQR